MQKQQKPKKNNKKKRTILLATLIPLGVAALATAITLPLVLKSRSTPEEQTKLTGIELESISLGQKNYTLTTEHINVYAVYKKGSETDKVPLNCGGLTGYTIKIDGTDVTSTFETKGFKFTQNKEYTIEVSFEGYTKSQKITVSDLTIAVTNKCDSRITFTDWTTGEKTVEPVTQIAMDFSIDSALKIDPTTSTITCGGEEIQDEDGVCFLAGKLIIPATLVTDDIELNLKLVEIDATVQNQTLEQGVAAIGEACNKYESGEITIDQFIQSFSVNPSGSTSITLTSPNELIGSQMTLTINNVEHTIRIIDVNHDDIWDGTKVSGKAALTFELVTLLSNSSGYIKSTFDTTESINYPNSIFRANLTGNGGGSKSWTTSAYSSLPDAWRSIIKTVQKTVATGKGFGTLTTYEDTLFPLTYTEMAQVNDQYAAVEGTTYQYWSSHNTNGDRIKYDSTDTACEYKLVTGQKYGDGYGLYKNAFIVDKNGSAYYVHEATDNDAVSFAFCV